MSSDSAKDAKEVDHDCGDDDSDDFDDDADDGNGDVNGCGFKKESQADKFDG